MSHTYKPHIPTFEGDDDPRHHWFIYETIWEATNITNEKKQITQFVRYLRKRALTWYMNFNENQSKSKNEIKQNFPTFFRTQDVKHLLAQKLKDIRQMLRESVQEYDKIFKDLLSKISTIN